MDKSELRVVEEERDGAAEEVGFGLEIGVENGDELAFFDVAAVHAIPESPSFVPTPVVPSLVPYVHSFASPSLAFLLHHFLFSNQLFSPSPIKI